MARAIRLGVLACIGAAVLAACELPDSAAARGPATSPLTRPATASRPATSQAASSQSAAPKSLVPAEQFWGKWEAKNDPKLLGKKIVADLLTRNFDDTNYAQRGGMSYPEVCDGYGCVRFVGQIKDQDALAKLVKRYEIIFTDAGSYLGPRANNVDNSAFGILPMEIYRQTGEKDERWLKYGIEYADVEWMNPTADGLTRFTRFWIDDMFMITSVQAEAYRVSKNRIYMDRAAKEMVAYLDRLQKPNGLFWHGEDAPFFWSRGNGWMSVGSAELLSILPENHPDRPRILAGYRKMMEGLLKNQGKDGMWHQLIDDPTSFAETSGTGMHVFGMAMGVRNGWLDEATYKEPVKKAWVALSSYLNADGKVREVCAGTNKSNSREFYLTRPRLVGDFHGQAAFIWAAWAMVRE